MSKLTVLKLIFKITLKLKLHIFYAYVIYFYTRRKSKSGNEGVLINFKDGTNILIGSLNHEALQLAIEERLKP